MSALSSEEFGGGSVEEFSPVISLKAFYGKGIVFWRAQQVQLSVGGPLIFFGAEKPNSSGYNHLNIPSSMKNQTNC